MSQLPPPPPPPPPPTRPSAPRVRYVDVPTPGPARGLPGWAVGVIVAAGVVIAGSVAALVLLSNDETPAVPTVVVPTSASPLPDSTPSPIDTPPRTLQELLPQTVGSFQLLTADSAPQFANNLDATDAIESRYLNPDGTEILHNVAVYSSEPKASKGRNKLLGGFEAIGYKVAESNRSRGIEVTRLTGPKEALVWSNGVILATVEGPPQIATQFFLDLPY